MKLGNLSSNKNKKGNKNKVIKLSRTKETLQNHLQW